MPWPFSRHPLQRDPLFGSVSLAQWLPWDMAPVAVLWVFHSLGPALVPRRFPAALPGEGRIPSTAVRCLWAAALFILRPRLPQANMQAYRVPYASLRMCSLGTRGFISCCQEAARNALCTASSSWSASTFAEDAYALCFSMVWICGVAALIPRRRVPLLTTVLSSA